MAASCRSQNQKPKKAEPAESVPVTAEPLEVGPMGTKPTEAGPSEVEPMPAESEDAKLAGGVALAEAQWR